MATVVHELTIGASPEAVYRISQDYAVRYAWDPFPERIELLDGARDIANGVRALVQAKNGLRMEVEFVQVAPPMTTAIKMTQGPVFLAAFAGSWIFKPDASGLTHARFVYALKCKPWALPWISERIACWYFAGVVRRRLQGLKTYCEHVQPSA